MPLLGNFNDRKKRSVDYSSVGTTGWGGGSGGGGGCRRVARSAQGGGRQIGAHLDSLNHDSGRLEEDRRRDERDVVLNQLAVERLHLLLHPRHASLMARLKASNKGDLPQDIQQG